MTSDQPTRHQFCIEDLRVTFPSSLGLLYSAIASYLGFAVNDGEYKGMGLAPYGTPRYYDRIRAMIVSLPA